MRYEKQHCPVCKREFAKNDEIVVCPVCGTPHHKNCYAENGECANENLHKDGYSYSPETEKEVQKCSYCGKELPEDASFCPRCGAPAESEKQPDGEQSAGSGFFTEQAESPFEKSNELIDGVPVSKVAAYVRYKAEYYVPKFKKLSNLKSKISWNWAAFLLPSCVWFYFRKCYLFGTLAALFNVFIEVLFFGFLTDFSAVSEMYYTGQNPAEIMARFNELLLSRQGIAFFALAIVIKILIGMFGNALYRFKALSDIKEGKTVSGVNFILPIIGYEVFGYLPSLIVNLFK